MKALPVHLAKAKSKLPELVDRVVRGEEFVITRHDADIARLVPASRQCKNRQVFTTGPPRL